MKESDNHAASVELSVIIPVFGNAGTLEPLVVRLDTVCSKIAKKYEFVFVDDASKDKSLIILKSIQKWCKHIKIIRHFRNKGQQEAIRTGLKNANGLVIAVIDADLQDPPEQLNKLYQALIKTPVETVFAIRCNNYQKRSRMLTSKIFKYIINRMCNMPKGAGAYLLMTKRMKDEILAFNTKSFYLAGLVCKTSLPYSGIDTPRSFGLHGNSAYDTGMRVKTALANIKCLLECGCPIGNFANEHKP